MSKANYGLKVKIPKKVAVIYGGLSSEKEICTMEGETVIELLKQKGHTVYPIKIDSSNNFLELLKDCPKNAILCLTEDLGIQWLLNFYGIKYNGSGPLATMLSLDKLLVKKLLETANILTPRYQLVTKEQVNNDLRIHLKIRLPLVIKPVRSGSSQGISLVINKRKLLSSLRKAFKEDAQILMEEFIHGTEITIVCLNSQLLGIVEIDKKGKPLYTYEAKLDGYVSYREPAQISSQAQKYIKSIVPKIVELFGLRNLFRIDTIVKGSRIFILEINTLPYLGEGGEPYEAVKNKGLDLYDLLTLVVSDFLQHKPRRLLE